MLCIRKYHVFIKTYLQVCPNRGQIESMKFQLVSVPIAQVFSRWECQNNHTGEPEVQAHSGKCSHQMKGHNELMCWKTKLNTYSLIEKKAQQQTKIHKAYQHQETGEKLFKDQRIIAMSKPKTKHEKHFFFFFFSPLKKNHHMKAKSYQKPFMVNCGNFNHQNAKQLHCN